MIIKYVRKNGRLHRSIATHFIEYYKVCNECPSYPTKVDQIENLSELFKDSKRFGFTTTHYFLITYKQSVAQVKS